MPNEEIVLRPRRVGIFKLCFSLFLFLFFGLLIVEPLLEKTGGFPMDQAIVVVGIPWLLVSLSIAMDLLGVRVTLLPSGKVRYRRIGFEKMDSDGEPAERFQRKQSSVEIRSGFGINHDTITPFVGWLRRSWQFVNVDEEIDPWEIDKAGYTQKIYKKRYYTNKQRRNSAEYILLIRKDSRCLKWRLKGFRTGEIEQLKMHIQKYNPEVKLYF